MNPQQKQYLVSQFATFQDEHHRSNSAFKMVREMNHFIEESKDQGFTDMTQLNQMVTHQIANQAVLYEDKSILDFIGHIETAGGNNYGNTMYARDLVTKVGNQIDRQKEKNERWRWSQEDRRREERDRSLVVELGEWYNAKNNPPEGWDEKTTWETLRSKLNSAGKYDMVKGVEDRAWTLNEREDISDLITVEEIQENDELRNELFELAKDPTLLYTYLMTKRNAEPKALEYLLKVNDPIQPINTYVPYKTATTGVRKFINGFAKQKVASFMPDFIAKGGDPFSEVPSSFLKLAPYYMMQYDALVEDAYERASRMKGGRRDFKFWNKEQKKAFADEIAIHNYDNPKRTDPIALLMREADSNLNSIMEDHLKPRSKLINTEDGILSGAIGNMYTRITGKESSGKVYAVELLSILEDAQTKFWSSEGGEWGTDGYLEQYWEEQGIDIDDEMTEGQKNRIKAWFLKIFEEIEKLIEQEKEAK